jgi:CRISPR-associated protein Csx14
MSFPEPSIKVDVDITNPGQFFACCGLLELAERIWPGAEGWFGDGDQQFLIHADGNLNHLVKVIATAELIHTRLDDPYSSPLIIGAPFRPLSIDWWETDRTGARDLKVWAGTMESFGIALAMQNAMKSDSFHDSNLFDVGMVVTTPNDGGKKKEPYYFDARRSPNAHSRDVGFSPNALSLTSTAHPAVELLCLVGLQVSRPAFTKQSRIYDYFTWHSPLMSNLLLPASTGMMQLVSARRYRFENWFRTGQRKHKAFRSAVSIRERSLTDVEAR